MQYLINHVLNSDRCPRLVILDYIIHNTDRGADNYMIKHCEGEHEKSLVDVAPSRSDSLQMPLLNGSKKQEGMTASPLLAALGSTSSQAGNSSSLLYTRQPHIHIAAIDNSLAFPHEHPKGWRSYTYGWLYLPVNLIGPPFSEKTRNHFLPLLTSKAWWEETTFQLRKLFSVDPDFNLKMFQVCGSHVAEHCCTHWNKATIGRHQRTGLECCAVLETSRRR